MKENAQETARNITHRCAGANGFSISDIEQMPFFIGPRASRDATGVPWQRFAWRLAAQRERSTQQNQQHLNRDPGPQWRQIEPADRPDDAPERPENRLAKRYQQALRR